MVDVEPRLVKLARLLVKQATKNNRFPDMGRVNTLVLDRIVAKPERPDNTDHPRVSWWVKTSTLTKGKPVEVGLLANTHFEHAYEDAIARGGGMCGVVQLHRVKGTKDFSMSLVLDIPDSAQRDTGRTVGLDFGMADALLATVDPYKADEFRVEAVVGDKEIDTIFTDGEPMKKDFHTFGVIDTIAATVAMLGEWPPPHFSTRKGETIQSQTNKQKRSCCMPVRLGIHQLHFFAHTTHAQALPSVVAYQ